MPAEIVFKSSAEREFRHLPREIQRRLRAHSSPWPKSQPDLDPASMSSPYAA